MTDNDGLENAEYRRKFSERLQKSLDLLGIGGRGKFKWLSDATGVSQQNVRKWLSGEALPEMRKIPELAKRLGVRLEWLIGGFGDMQRDDKTMWIPIISWSDISRWLDPAVRNNVKRLNELPFLVKAGTDTFAVAMQGASMEPDFMDGDFVVVDPGQPWKHQSFVLASAGSGTETIRKALMDGGRPVLLLSNLKYPSQVDSERNLILGTVIGKIRIL